MFGLPDHIRACLFDLDGGSTPATPVRAAHGKEHALGAPRTRIAPVAPPFRPIDPVADYEKYADGKTRDGGARSCPNVRDIRFLEGGPADPPESEKVNGPVARKDPFTTTRLRTNGVAPYPGPEPDPFHAAATRQGVPPAATAVLEGAMGVVAVDRTDRFGSVIGIASTGASGGLNARGADIVLQDLAELLGQEC